MFAALRTLSAALVFLSSSWAYPPTASASGKVAEAVLGPTATVANAHPGQYFIVALPANPGTGYSWSVTHFARGSIAEFVGGSYLAPAAQRPGAGGTALLIFKAIARGSTFVTLGYARPWERSKPAARTMTFRVVVAP